MSLLGATLPGYLRRRVGAQILLLLLGITALMQVLDLLEVTSEILRRGLGVGGLLYYALLRMPGELVLALPLSVLLGTTLSLGAMARALEITAMRSAGVNLMRMLGLLLPMLLVVAAAQFALSELAVPRAETELKRWWSATALPDDEAQAGRRWARTDAGPVSIASNSPDGSRLQDVRVYARDPSGLLTAWLTAAEARWDGRGWQLQRVTELRIGDGAVQRLQQPTREWRTNLRPDDVLRLDDARPHLSTLMIVEVIAGKRAGSQPRSYYQTDLYRGFTAPLAVIVMLLLAMPTACASARGGGRGVEMLVALVLGLAFLLCDGIVAALSASGSYPPLPMALVAPIVFAAIGLAQTWAYDRA